MWSSVTLTPQTLVPMLRNAGPISSRVRLLSFCVVPVSVSVVRELLSADAATDEALLMLTELRRREGVVDDDAMRVLLVDISRGVGTKVSTELPSLSFVWLEK